VEVNHIQEYISGGIYSIEFRGVAPEFIGIHPAIIIRTLKENELFMVIPLTSYTSERWEKTRKFGFGVKVNETDSIAKVDKFKVIHKNAIRNRWVSQYDGRPLSIDLDTFKNVVNKLEEYMRLSGLVALKEYGKHLNQLALLNDNEVDILSENN